MRTPERDAIKSSHIVDEELVAIYMEKRRSLQYFVNCYEPHYVYMLEKIF